MPRFSRLAQVTPQTAKPGDIREILYDADTGHVIDWMPVLNLRPGRDPFLRVQSGEWRILTRALNTRDILELEAVDAEIQGGAIVRKDTSIIEEP